MPGAMKGPSWRRMEMAGKKVTVMALIKAKSGYEDKVREALLNLVSRTRKEAGCINYDLHQSSAEKSLFMFYENWVSKKDLDEHLEQPYLRDFFGKAEEMLAEPIEIKLWEMIS
jgi:quinol monooxygenase YgiN